MEVQLYYNFSAICRLPCFDGAIGVCIYVSDPIELGPHDSKISQGHTRRVKFAKGFKGAMSPFLVSL